MQALIKIYFVILQNFNEFTKNVKDKVNSKIHLWFGFQRPTLPTSANKALVGVFFFKARCKFPHMTLQREIANGRMTLQREIADRRFDQIPKLKNWFEVFRLSFYGTL